MLKNALNALRLKAFHSEIAWHSNNDQAFSHSCKRAKTSGRLYKGNVVCI